MNKRCIRKHDLSKWLKVCRNTKKESFTIDNVSIVKNVARRGWDCKIVDVQHTLKCECGECINVHSLKIHNCTTFDSFYEPMILASIIESYIFTWVGFLHGPFFWHPSSYIFNTWQIFISISIPGSSFRVLESRH